MRLPQRAFCFSRLHAARLREEGLRGEVTVLEGEYRGPAGAAAEPAEAQDVVVFAGRHIPEKRVPALVPAIAKARETVPDLRCDIYGDGPDRAAVEAAVREHGLDGVVRVHGFVDGETVDRALARALCMVLPSRREGYGLVVVEAASRGHAQRGRRRPRQRGDRAGRRGRERVGRGVRVAADDLAAAILRVREAGPALRERTAAWFARNAQRLSIDSSIETVLEYYRRASASARS